MGFRVPFQEERDKLWGGGQGGRNQSSSALKHLKGVSGPKQSKTITYRSRCCLGGCAKGVLFLKNRNKTQHSTQQQPSYNLGYSSPCVTLDLWFPLALSFIDSWLVNHPGFREVTKNLSLKWLVFTVGRLEACPLDCSVLAIYGKTEEELSLKEKKNKTKQVFLVTRRGFYSQTL